MRKPKRSYVEALLERARRQPSKTCPDPQQLDIDTYIKRMAFEVLDKAIQQKLDEI